jgi:hypothetical protein
MLGRGQWLFKDGQARDTKVRASDAGAEGQPLSAIPGAASEDEVPLMAKAAAYEDEVPLIAKAAARELAEAMRHEATQPKRCGLVPCCQPQI